MVDFLTAFFILTSELTCIQVAELRQELMARDLETKGVKSVLCVRLQEALNQEKAKEEGTMEEKVSGF